jgi:hypothetical protein
LGGNLYPRGGDFDNSARSYPWRAEAEYQRLFGTTAAGRTALSAGAATG